MTSPASAGSRTRESLPLALIMLGYLALALLYARFTPPWQAPDEPAHYNYIAYLAENGRFPVLHMGDYPHAYLEEIKARRFPPELSIAPIRYEFHQPPLYYALLSPVFALTGRALLPLRLASVLLGAGLVLCAYAIAKRIFPEQAGLALGTAAFVAFLPQHLATVSQVGNDVLAELLFALALYQLVGWVLGPAKPQAPAEDLREPGTWAFPRLAAGRAGFALPNRRLLGMGILLGLILITKTTAYIAAALAAAVLIGRWVKGRAPVGRALAEAALAGGPAALIALPWYGRNIWTYGWPDFLGLIRHDAIVAGQLRTGEFLAQYGWASYLRRLAEFTFKSFWGVFGWLGVFMDSRVYLALLILCLVAAGGLVWRLIARTPRGGDTRRGSKNALRLLALSALLTLLVYAWYNVRFVQHQGRYLFTALIPIAIGFALGWDGAIRPPGARIVAAGLALLGAGLAALGLASGTGLPKWPLAMIMAAVGGLCVADRVQARWPGRSLRVRPLLFAMPFAALPFIALYGLFGAIVPQWAR